MKVLCQLCGAVIGTTNANGTVSLRVAAADLQGGAFGLQDADDELVAGWLEVELDDAQFGRCHRHGPRLVSPADLRAKLAAGAPTHRA